MRNSIRKTTGRNKLWALMNTQTVSDITSLNRGTTSLRDMQKIFNTLEEAGRGILPFFPSDVTR